VPDPRGRAFAAAGAVVALDRITKHLVESRVSFFDSVHVIPGCFDIVHSTNRGAAFGLFNDAASGWRAGVLPLLSALAVITISVVLWKGRRLEKWLMLGLALILGGAAGNLFDRLAWGRVTDFLLFYIGQYQWPAFNVADSAIVIGSGLIALDALNPKRKPDVS
jgi:signal peptidase II